MMMIQKYNSTPLFCGIFNDSAVILPSIIISSSCTTLIHSLEHHGNQINIHETHISPITYSHYDNINNNKDMFDFAEDCIKQFIKETNVSINRCHIYADIHIHITLKFCTITIGADFI